MAEDINVVAQKYLRGHPREEEDRKRAVELAGKDARKINKNSGKRKTGRKKRGATARPSPRR